MDYQQATDEQMDQILTNRLRQLELEHFGQTLQLQEENADPNITDEQREMTQKNLASLEARIAVNTKALASRPKPDVKTVTSPQE